MKINKTCYIIGSGASIREHYWNASVYKLPIWNVLRNHFVITLNWAYKFINPTIEMFVDYAFYETEKRHMKDLNLVIGKDDPFFIREQKKFDTSINKTLFLLKNAIALKQKEQTAHYWGKDAWKNGFYCGQLCGIFALSIAIQLGFEKIYLFGYDGNETDGYTHFYQDDNAIGHITFEEQSRCGIGKDGHGKYKTDTYNKDINVWFEPFKEELNNIEIVNVNTNSAINIFPKISYKDFYKDIRNDKDINTLNIQEKIKDILKEHLETKI